VRNDAAKDFMGIACRHQAFVLTECKETGETVVPFEITADYFLSSFCL
jgi:hypothetical protein